MSLLIVICLPDYLPLIVTCILQVRENGNPQFVPAMKAWVSNANDYGK